MYYGFDIGGTKIEFGAFDASLQRVATERVPTPSHDYDELLRIVVTLVEKYDRQFDCEGKAGIGFPGSENTKDGIVTTVNVPAATGRTFRADLQAKLGRAVSLNNDANCFALSEAWDDELKDKAVVLGLIMGTGFGGGIVVNGKVLSGRNNIAGEVGHMCLPANAWLHLQRYFGDNAPLFECGCKQKGCLDNYLSGRGFELLYNHRYDVQNQGSTKKAIEIINDYRAGKPEATQFVDVYFEMVAMVFAGLVSAIDPDAIVVGGGLSNFDELFEALPERITKYLLTGDINPVSIAKAKYGDAGGVRGAAFLNLTQS